MTVGTHIFNLLGITGEANNVIDLLHCVFTYAYFLLEMLILIVDE